MTKSSKKMTIDKLAQVTQAEFRLVRGEFKAVRGEMADEFKAVREEMATNLKSTEVKILQAVDKIAVRFDKAEKIALAT